MYQGIFVSYATPVTLEWGLCVNVLPILQKPSHPDATLTCCFFFLLLLFLVAN